MDPSKDAGQSQQLSKMHAIDNGAHTVVEGTAKGGRAGVDRGCNENGNYNYDPEKDCYTLEPIGAEEKGSFVLPGYLYRKLMVHQVEGLKWLWGIHCRHLGAVVADDMGLGKTLQAAVFLSALFHSNLIRRVLVIVPLSVLDQWPDELKEAGIDELLYTYYNCDDSVLNTVMKHECILLTTYETYARNYKKMMGSSKAKWDYAILDEAHRIKNINSITRGLVAKIKCSKKILLTGTPLQKDLMDMYSLMDFINPGLLGDVTTFHKKYLCPISRGKYANATEQEKDDYAKAIEGVKSTTDTYVLRRNKDVLIESGHLICKKNDMVIWLRLTEFQIKLYIKLENIFLKRSQQSKKSGLSKQSTWQSICNSPSVLLSKQEDNPKAGIQTMKDELINSFDVQTLSDEANSCKTMFVMDLIKQIFEEEAKTKEEDPEEGEYTCKILIFSRSLSMLDVIEKCLYNIVEKDDIIRIDGSVERESRKGLIKKFKSNVGPRIFLLSARVGGEGLNLTAATRVIIIDPSWNSSDDGQISDRVYRMGQKRDVYIYRLVTCSTVEEHTYKTQLLKGALGRGILEGTPCGSSVLKKEGKVLCLPDTNVGFDSSETHALLESTKANTVDFDGPHLKFLRSHRMVAGITNQNHVLFKEETSRSDLLQEESSDGDSDVLNRREAAKPRSFHVVAGSSRMLISNRHPSKKKDAAPKQQDLTTRNMSSQTIKISENKVALLIGKGGGTIKMIMRKSSASISVEDRKAGPRSSQASVVITGTDEEIEKAKQMILDVTSEVEPLRSGVPEKFLHVPEDLIGTIIGKQGRTIKDIMQKSGAYVEFVENKKGFRLSGSGQKIESAELLINKIIDKVEKYVLVPQDKVGLVIGRHGRMLTEIKEKSGACIKYIDHQKKFLLAGKQQVVDSAEALILEIINKPRRRGATGAIAQSDEYQRRAVPPQPVPPQPVPQQGNRSLYYGERGPPGPV